MREVEAKYADGLAMGRALLQRLRTAGGEVLLNPGVEKFWSEHSDRATLPSWVGCVATFPTDWIANLGRWAGGCSDAYVRTTMLRIRKMQLASVALYRRAEDASAAFGEEEVLGKLGEWMHDKGFSLAEINSQLDRLAVSGQQAPPSPTDLADASSDEDDEKTPEAMPEASPRLVVVDPTEAEIPIGSYIVSIQARSRFKRLHRLGECWRKPGVDYVEYEVLGLELPPASRYSAVCRTCFANGEVNAEEVSSGSSSSEGSEGA